VVRKECCFALTPTLSLAGEGVAGPLIDSPRKGGKEFVNDNRRIGIGWKAKAGLRAVVLEAARLLGVARQLAVAGVFVADHR
jgi:hypothetical protein